MSDTILTRQYEWPLIARDIAMLANPVEGASRFSLEDIRKAHGISEEDFAALSDLPTFCNLVEQELERVKGLGPAAGVRMRAEAMAMALQEQLFQQAQSGELDAKGALQFLAMLMKSAGIEQPPEMAQAQAPKQNVSISFNIPKLHSNGKLAHLAALPQTKIIEGEL